MAKKTFVTAIIITAFLVLLVVGMQVAKVAKANPFMIFHEISPIVGASPPYITISSPQNNSVWLPGKITVSFNVTRPQLGTCDSQIIDVNYTLGNDNAIQAFTIWQPNPGGGYSAGSNSGIPEYNTTFDLPFLSNGNHNLTVAADGVVFPGNMTIFWMDSSSTVFFKVGAQITEPSQAPSPSPTFSPSPLLTPSKTLAITPTPEVTFYTQMRSPFSLPPNQASNKTNSNWLYVILVIVAIVAVGLMVYFRKLRNRNRLIE